MKLGDKLTVQEREQDIVALSRLLSYAQLEAKRLGLDKTEGNLRAALNSLLIDAAVVLATAGYGEPVTLRLD
jgi:hypothetical protein